MPKAILKMEMPENCWQCELYSTAHNCCNVIVIVGHYAICPSKGRRPDCPLKLMEDKEVESGRIIDRLAAYEDSGLTPDEVQELAQAKADGRLVVLPCKDGGRAMRMIYIAHPFGGEQENVEKIEKIVKGLIHKHPDCTFYSPLHATGFLYDKLDYLEGMEHCFEALSRCDELWICGDWRESRGCNMEYGFAKAKGIPVKFINN